MAALPIRCLVLMGDFALEMVHQVEMRFRNPAESSADGKYFRMAAIVVQLPFLSAIHLFRCCPLVVAGVVCVASHYGALEDHSDVCFYTRAVDDPVAVPLFLQPSGVFSSQKAVAYFSQLNI